MNIWICVFLKVLRPLGFATSLWLASSVSGAFGAPSSISGDSMGVAVAEWKRRRNG